MCAGPIIPLEKADTGEFGACIEPPPYGDVRDEKGQLNDLCKLVTLISVGMSGTAERTLTSKIEIGAKSVPDALKYAIGVHKTCINGVDCIAGEGNLFLTWWSFN